MNRTYRCRLATGYAALTVLLAWQFSGCAEHRGGPAAGQPTYDLYAPTKSPQVVALGNLRSGKPPSKAEVELAMFLFGVEPERPLGLIRPAGVTARNAQLLICDTALNATLRWDRAAGNLAEPRLAERPLRPADADITPNGDVLIADVAASVVRRYDAAGSLVQTYTLADEEFRPAGVLSVDDTVWVSNLAARRVEVFNADTGEHLRSLGGRGDRPPHFGLPLGMARTPSGDVCVVDMLKNRVLVFDASGNSLRSIGQPGDLVGCFGRPKDVAVGPDGAVFVTDAASQRVHAFAPDGRPLLAFGHTGANRLAVPAGIAISSESPLDDVALPEGFTAAYYVLVAEQILEPGVRIYAWSSPSYPVPSTASVDARSATGVSASPHWNPEGCTRCHAQGADGLLPIGADVAGELCRDCHDGHEDAVWAHPVDGSAEGPGRRAPSGWPLSDARIDCRTCHDVKRHCRPDARRPTVNSGMLREDEPDFCGKCHEDTAGWVASPHGQLDYEGRINQQACLFCHRGVPAIPDDGVRRFEPQLRDESGSCLNCHTQHWDYFIPGHVNRVVPPAFRQRMPAEIPLADGRVACYTCHNPHQPGLFPAGSELAARAAAGDAAFRLRADRPGLCLQCHDK